MWTDSHPGSAETPLINVKYFFGLATIKIPGLGGFFGCRVRCGGRLLFLFGLFQPITG